MSELTPYSYTLSYNRDDPADVQKTMQKLMERLVGMTLACGVPYRLSIDYQDYTKKGLPKPKSMKLKHNSLMRWSAYFRQEKITELKDTAAQDKATKKKTKA